MSRTALILAGGESRRFGGRKPLAPFEGRPLVRWVADALADLCDELLVSIGTGDDALPYLEAVPAARVVRDARGERGPIEGFLQGFRAARGDPVFVAPADAPLLRSGLYRALLARLGDHDAAVPRHSAMDPVRAVYRRSPVLRSLAEDVASPSALVDRLDAVFLQGPDLRAADPALASFVDVNRTEDLAAARGLVSAGP